MSRFSGDFFYQGSDLTYTVREDTDRILDSIALVGWKNNTYETLSGRPGPNIYADFEVGPVSNGYVNIGRSPSNKDYYYFRPDKDFSGDQIITLNYRVGRDELGWKPASLKIRVLPENDAPVQVKGFKLYTDENRIFQILDSQLLEAVNDVDGDTLSVKSIDISYTEGSSRRRSVKTERNSTGFDVYIPEINNVYNYNEGKGYSNGFNMNYVVTDSKGGEVRIKATIMVRDLDTPINKSSSTAVEEGSDVHSVSQESNSPTTSVKTWNTLNFGRSSKPRDIISQWLGSGTSNKQVLPLSGGDRLNIQASSWSGNVRLKSVAQAADSGGLLEAPQIEIPSPMPTGSALNGGSGRDRILAKAGWDVIDGGSGDDYIRAGNGRDIITGGLGNDELWGDFGWNTYKSEKDGFRDLIAIKSDEYLLNWLNGKAGNNPNGEKADIIEGLDSNDVIKILGVSTEDLSFGNATAHGVSGIGIYGGGALEAVYTGGDLSIDQIRSMTTGDVNFPGGGYGAW